MKNMDFRSLMVGFLGCICIFLIMGQNRGNMGDIVVNSITVKDNGDGGFIRTQNQYGVQTVYLGTAKAGGGLISTHNKDGIQTSYMGTGDGSLGFLELFNVYGNRTAYFGTNNSNDGMVVLCDRYGDIQWFETTSKD